MIIGVPKELCPGETRVALVPANVAALVKQGREVLMEAGAGDAAGYPDALYVEAGARLVSRAEVFAGANIIAQVQTAGQNRVNGDADVASLKAGQLLIGMMDPLGNPAFAQQVAKTGASGMAMELIPRISRAQSMDVLSSMAMIAGYKAVLIAASTSPRMFPMNMTAAGTLSPARVFIMGAGVAGLQACATARRLGAVVEAYDVRAAAREQILSVGAKPIELQIATESAEGKGGYAAEQSDEFIRKQREAMADVLAQQDVVITTAAIPGAKSPVLVTAEMVKRMKPGAVIVDLAAERGGNCELTELGKVVVAHGVTILGPDNVPSTVAFHASQMYGKNVENTLMHLIDKEGNLTYDLEDEIVVGTLVAHQGDVPHQRLRDLLKLAPKA
ncbi:MAG TPA: Re/Si-specific NAD(P)(+) transhydrogenase subunit alpha [Pseudomonadales bacterium]